MISSMAQLILELKRAEEKKLASYEITHPGTIGDMYEGLSTELLGLAIPEEFNVQVVSGFAVGVDGALSPQLDVMVVHGQGDPVPYAKVCKWPISQVLAVMEIKKNLYGNDLEDGLNKMSAVYKLDLAARRSLGTDTSLSTAIQSFARLTGTYPLTDAEARALPDGLGCVFDIFKEEQLGPVRVILGYGGFTSELGLRDGFIEKIQANSDINSWPERMPSLVICRNNSIVKLNGQPYCSTLSREKFWPFIASNSQNPIRLLLEQVWTKLTTTFEIVVKMDDTLDLERLSPLLLCKFSIDSSSDTRKVEYQHIDLDAAQLEATPIREWAPTVSDENESVLIAQAGANGLDLNSPDLQQWALDEGFNLLQACEELVAKRILAWSSKSTLRPVDDVVITTISPGGEMSTAGNAELLGLWLTRPDGRSSDGST